MNYTPLISQILNNLFYLFLACVIGASIRGCITAYWEGWTKGVAANADKSLREAYYANYNMRLKACEEAFIAFLASASPLTWEERMGIRQKFLKLYGLEDEVKVS